MVPALHRPHRNQTLPGFALPFPVRRRFNPVIDRIADDVHQRVGQLFHDQLVQLHLSAGDRELDLLSRVAGDPSNQPVQFVEDLTQRYHSGFQNALLQLVELAAQKPALPIQLLSP